MDNTTVLLALLLNISGIGLSLVKRFPAPILSFASIALLHFSKPHGAYSDTFILGSFTLMLLLSLSEFLNLGKYDDKISFITKASSISSGLIALIITYILHIQTPVFIPLSITFFGILSYTISLRLKKTNHLDDVTEGIVISTIIMKFSFVYSLSFFFFKYL